MCRVPDASAAPSRHTAACQSDGVPDTATSAARAGASGVGADEHPTMVNPTTAAAPQVAHQPAGVSVISMSFCPNLAEFARRRECICAPAAQRPTRRILSQP